YGRGYALGNLGRYEEALASYDKAVVIKPDYHEAWYNRGYALGNVGRYEEALASYDKALAIKPDLHLAWYNKARCYVLQNQLDQGLENLSKAIHLNSECGEWAKTDSDFDIIRDDARFVALIQG
uniref:TPR end-of-group domain-containing protein n=1 Tax=Calothrix rhizosoleniae TaxID=888997 RepID=UPI00117774EA